MSNNNNKNKPQSTITKLIDYFNDEEEEEEEEEEEQEININQKNELSSLGVSGKISRLYSYRDENEIEENQNESLENNDNDIINNKASIKKENHINNNELQNKIFTTLYANEQPDSSFCCEEQPKDKSKINNTEFIGRAVSFHRDKDNNDQNEMSNDDNKNKMSLGFREGNKEISKISKENTFTNTGINYIDNEASFSKEKINITNNDINNNNNDNNKININSMNSNKDNNLNNNKTDNISDINIKNNNNTKKISNIDENSNNNVEKQKENYINNSLNNNNINEENNEENFINNNKNIENNYNINNNGYLMDINEKTLEEQETEFLELERQRKEKEKIRKKREQLLEQLRIKEEEKKSLEKKLEEKKIKEMNKTQKINNEYNVNNINDNTKDNKSINQKIINNNIKTEIKIDNKLNNNNDNIIKNKENNDKNNNKEIIYNNINNEENNKENELINSINYQKFDSFKNINNIINNRKENINNKMKNNQESNIQEEINKKLFKPEYLIDSNTFDEIQNNKNNIYQVNNRKGNNTKNKIEESKKNIIDKENKNIKILKNLISFDNDKKKEETKKIGKKINILNNYNNNYNTYRNPIELTLYNDALKRRKKLENIDKTIMKGIKLNSNKTKITNASYKVAIEKDEKNIEKIINRYSILNKKNNTKYINIIGIALSLRDMKIFRELFKENKFNININYNKKGLYSLLTLKKIILSVDKKENRKIKEINFLQQTWLLLNKDIDKEYINKDIFFGLLKIIFSPEGTLKEIEDLLNKYLEAVLVGVNIFNTNNNKNSIKINNKNDILTKDILITPLVNKIIKYESIWPLSKYLKTFFELKKNLIAYKTTDNLNNLNKEKYIDNFAKHKKIQSNIVNCVYGVPEGDEGGPYQPPQKNFIKEKKGSNFDKLYQKFLEKEQCRKAVLEEMRKKKEQDELKELKEKPTISKYRANTISENEFIQMGKKREDIHDRLYKMDKDIKAKKMELIEEKQKLEEEKIKKERKKNKLNVNSRLSKLRMNKSFDQPYKCKGFNEFVKRTRQGRLERLRVKYLLEKTPQGENYEEIRRRNITPPNITDIRRMRQKAELKNKKEEIDNNDESDGNTEYFNLQIKLPNGRIQTLKVYENDDANKVVEEFCKIHSVDDNIKNKLVANIEYCQKQYLNKDNENNENDNEGDNEEGEEVEEEQNNILVDKY